MNTRHKHLQEQRDSRMSTSSKKPTRKTSKPNNEIIGKDNELEKDFLMKWIDVIDYQQNQIVEIGPERSAQKAEITEITEIR